MDELPVQSGTYALILGLHDAYSLRVGRLGSFKFPAGIYIYLGSACGPGGLRSRLKRHLSGGSRFHWHIDHLRSVAEVVGYAYVVSDGEESHVFPSECEWREALSVSPCATIPVPGFGASDCKSGCPAHLIHLCKPEYVGEISDILNYAKGEHQFNLVLFDHKVCEDS